MKIAILLIALMLPLSGVSCKSKGGRDTSGSEAYSKAWKRCITPIREANREAGVQAIETEKWTRCEGIALEASRKARGKSTPEQAPGEEPKPERKRGKVRCFFAKAVSILPFVKNACSEP
ncbi:MAG: hypothetical protein OXU53_11415 [Deltaproteobacteria bacterium]|nr:hypothetical protein [Deltaproteobacteria bacterium]